MKPSRSTPSQSLGWKNSPLSVPKKPSMRALSQLRPLRDMLLTSRLARQTRTHPFQR